MSESKVDSANARKQSTRIIIPSLRLIGVVCAILGAIRAQSGIANSNIPANSITLYGLAIALFCLSTFGATSGIFAGNKLFVAPNDTLSRILSLRHLIVLAVSLALSAGGYIAFNQNNNSAGWWLFLLSMLVLSIGFANFSLSGIKLRFNNGRQRAFLSIAISVLGVLSLIGLGLIGRTYQLDQYPFGIWYDEAAIGAFARKILNDPALRPICCEPVTLPSHFTYLVTASFALLGVSVSALRLVSVIWGVMAVVFAYLLFKRWFGNPAGWFAAALLAVLRYHVIWSRLSAGWITPPTFELAFIYFFDLALENKQPRHFVWAGLTLGLSIGFYYPTRLFFAVVLVYGLLILLAWVIRRIKTPKIDRGNFLSLRSLSKLSVFLGGVFVISGIIGGMPIIKTFVENPKDFMARTATVSIFSDHTGTDLENTLKSQVSKHLLMFNVHGDNNPRHNFPGDPMLDPIMGGLAVLGLAYTLLNFYKPANLIMILTFVIMLMGGILSLDFESPQSLRSIGVIPAIIYFSAVPITLFLRFGTQIWSSIAKGNQIPSQISASAQNPKTISMLATGLKILVIAGMGSVIYSIGKLNWDEYFVRQMGSSAVYTDHSAAETITAMQIINDAQDYDVIVSRAFIGTPAVQFLAPESVKKVKDWTGNEPLNLPTSGDRGAAILIEPRLESAFSLLRRTYPNAIFRQYEPPMGGEKMVYEALLSPTDLRNAQGVIAGIFPNGDYSSIIKKISLADINGDWSKNPPIDQPFSAEFKTTLNVAQDGIYKFSLNTSQPSQLFVDEFLYNGSAVNLARGNHLLRIRLPNGRTKFELVWQRPGSTKTESIPPTALIKPPVSNSGLLATYFRSPDWSGPSALTQIEPEINFYYHILPLPRPYSIEWKGKIFAPISGTYVFLTDSRDESFLSIDNKLLIENQLGGSKQQNSINLEKGWHDILLRFADKTGYTHMYLYWQTPGGKEEIIPYRYFAPPMGAYPTENDLAALPEPAKIEKVFSSKIRDVERAYQPLSSAPIPPAAPTNIPATKQPEAVVSKTSPASAPIPDVPRLNLIAEKLIGKEGDAPGEFRSPHGMAIGKNGWLFVTDTGNKRLQVFDQNGNYLKVITGGPELFEEPYDVKIASNGDVWVLDSSEGWIYHFSPEGNVAGPRIGGTTINFYKPRGFAIDKTDNLYIADTGKSRVIKLSLSGDMLTSYGERGTDNGNFIEPGNIAVSPTGDIYVTDVPNRRIQRFDSKMKFINEIAVPLAGASNGPSIAFTQNQSLLITAPEPHKIQLYSLNGELMGQIGEFGTDLGQYRLPTGIAINGNAVWVSDTGNNRIQKLSFSP